MADKSPIKTVALLLVLVLFLAIGFLLVKILIKARNKPVPKLTQSSMKEEIVDFTRTIIPDLHANLLLLDREIDIINREIERLNALEKEFPLQKKIVDSEKTVLGKARKNLVNVMGNTEKEIETLYVSYQVDKKKGTLLIPEEKRKLISTIRDALLATKANTARLKIKKKKGVAEKVKEIL